MHFNNCTYFGTDSTTAKIMPRVATVNSNIEYYLNYRWKITNIFNFIEYIIGKVAF